MDKKTRATLHGWAAERRRRPLRSVLLTLGACLVLGILWSTFIVVDARRRTPEVLERITASQAMPSRCRASRPATWICSSLCRIRNFTITTVSICWLHRDA